MARSLGAPKFDVKMTASLRNTLTDTTAATVAQPNFNYSKTLTTGIDENQANRAWMSKNRDIAQFGQETFDLYGMASIDIGAGVGLDALGQDVVYEEIVSIAIVNENDIDAAGQLEIIPANSQGWGPIGTHTVANGGALSGQGCLFKANPAAGGFDVVNGASHRITLRASGGDVTYSIYLLARHDDEESSSGSSSSSSSSYSSSSSSSISSASSSSSSSFSISTSSSSISTSSISTSSSSTSSVSSSSAVSSSSTSSLSSSSESSSSLSGSSQS